MPEKLEVKIRKYPGSDCKELTELLYNVVYTVNSKYLDGQQGIVVLTLRVVKNSDKIY